MNLQQEAGNKAEAAGDSVRPVILTGAKPSGELTLGNFLGALRNWVLMQEEFDCYFPIVDLHALTTPCVPAELRKRTYACLAHYLACGLDPEKSRIFLQSHIVGHAELAWVLACHTPVGDLHRMTQFKDKSARPGASVNSGLLFYPVLMAADILLYNADRVPVGEDQKQHIELARNLAQRFNAAYSPTFSVPEPFIPQSGARVMSLQDPERKMSKTDENENDYILLLDPPEKIRKKILSAVTDSGTEVRAAPEKPGITNLLHIFSAVTGQSVAELEQTYSGSGYGTFKKEAAEAVIERLEPVQQAYAELIRDKAYLEKVLKEGAEAAQARAYRMLSKVYRKVGLVERMR